MPRTGKRAPARKAVTNPVPASEAEEQNGSTKPPPTKVRKISTATTISNGISTEAEHSSTSPSKPKPDDFLDSDFEGDDSQEGAAVPLSQTFEEGMSFLQSLSQKTPAMGISPTTLTPDVTMPPPASRKRERERSVSPEAAPQPQHARRMAVLEHQSVSLGGNPANKTTLDSIPPQPQFQIPQDPIDDGDNSLTQSETLRNFMEELAAFAHERKGHGKTVEQAVPPATAPPALDAAGFIVKDRHIIIDSDDEDDGVVLGPRRRTGESEAQFKTRVAFEKTIRDKNQLFAEKRKAEGSGKLDDLLSIIPLEDRVLTSRKKRLVKKADIDRAINGEDDEEDEEGDKEPLDIAQAQKKQLEEAIKRLKMRERERSFRKTVTVDGHKKTIDVTEKQFFIKGMTTSLLPHQIICVDWMVNEREIPRSSPYGGLLGDAMGLGKTMQCIATMCANPPPQEYTSEDPRVTLIVCPVALVQQWKREIEQHTKPGKFNIRIHHGREKFRDAADLRRAQVVITTYGMVGQSFPEIHVPDTIEPDERKSFWNREFKKKRGILHRVMYWRVIFDECHVIRNKDTRQSKGARHLESEQSWCLSGTPIFNGLWDLYPVFSIVGMPRLKNADLYRTIIKLPNAAKTIQVALRAAMMRRTKEDEFMGKPLIELPPKEVKQVFIQFDPDSRALYTMYEELARSSINDLAMRDRLGSNYSYVLVLLLRLRQLCNHPFLTANELKFWRRRDFEACIERCDTFFEQEFGEDALREFKRVTAGAVAEFEGAQTDESSEPGTKDPEVKMAKKDTIQTEQNVLDNIFAKLGLPPPGTSMLDTSVTTKENRPVRDFLERCLKQLPANRGGEDDANPLGLGAGEEPCPICMDQVTNAVATACQHVFCRDCITNAIEQAANTGADYDCPVCQSKKIEKDDLKLHGERGTEAANRAMAALDLQDTDAERKKSQKKIDKEFNDNISKNFFMTKKLEVMRDQLRQWRDDRPDDKVVLFSQFTKFLDIVEKVTDTEGWTTTRYQGDMPINIREEALVKFREDPECWIMLTSTKAGGVGLNLTHANLVISMDLWWNAASELQAFDRVHRLGQRKDVEVMRFIMENSVETRMLKLQEEKLEIAGIALGEGDFKLGKLSTKDLLGLFGAVDHDRDGRMVVRPDANPMPGAFPGGVNMGDVLGLGVHGGGEGDDHEMEDDQDEDEDMDEDDDEDEDEEMTD